MTFCMTNQYGTGYYLYAYFTCICCLRLRVTNFDGSSVECSNYKILFDVEVYVPLRAEYRKVRVRVRVLVEELLFEF
jgi:hypothetical protein